MLDRSLAPDLGVIDENEVVSDGLSAKDNELSDNQNIDRSVRTVLCGANHILISGIIPQANGFLPTRTRKGMVQ